MKQETYLNKLNELLGIDPGVAQQIKKKVEAKKGNVIGVTEDEIQEYREAEGILYFLEAPHLFHARVCKRCEEPFLVSRLHVAYCSYNCIEHSIWDLYGVKWSRSTQLETDPELVVREVFEGNEPIWIRRLPTLQKALIKLTNALVQLQEESESSQVVTSPSEVSTPSPSRPIQTSQIPIPKSR